jgi:hypothetical protein
VRIYAQISNLERAHEGIKLDDGVGGSSGAYLLILSAGGKIGGLNRLEEFSGSLLLFGSRGKATSGTTGLVHETSEFVAHIEPLFPRNVPGELLQTQTRLSEDLPLTVSVLLVVRVVVRVSFDVTIHRVGRVDLSGLVRSVGGTLGVRSSISKQSENRETRRFSDGSLGGSGEEGSTKRSKGGSSTSGDGFTAGGGILIKKERQIGRLE